MLTGLTVSRPCHLLDSLVGARVWPTAARLLDEARYRDPRAEGLRERIAARLRGAG